MLSKEQLCASVHLCIQELREATAFDPDLCGFQEALTICTDFVLEVKRLNKTGRKG